MSSLTNLDGRVAVITGGASGIGKGIAIALKARGVTVVIADIEKAPLEATAAELGVESLLLDVTDAAAVADVANQVVASHGRVDIVVNNAGVGLLKPIDTLSLEDFRWVVDVNLWGVIHGINAFLPHLKTNPDGGYIVNTASMAGLIAGPGMSAYSASKFAVVGLTEVLAAELTGTKIGASVLVPALVRTNIATGERNRPGVDPRILDAAANDDFVPPGRMIEPEEVGDMVADAIQSGDLYIVTHPETLPMVQFRTDAITAAFTRAAAAQGEPEARA